MFVIQLPSLLSKGSVWGSGHSKSHACKLPAYTHAVCYRDLGQLGCKRVGLCSTMSQADFVLWYLSDYSYLNNSLSEGMIGHIDIDMALLRVLTQRFKLGMFDPPEQQPWSAIPMNVVGSRRHHELAIEAVRRGTK